MKCANHRSIIKMEKVLERKIFEDLLFTYHYRCLDCSTRFEERSYIRRDETYFRCTNCDNTIKETSFLPDRLGNLELFMYCPNISCVRSQHRASPHSDDYGLITRGHGLSVTEYHLTLKETEEIVRNTAPIKLNDKDSVLEYALKLRRANDEFLFDSRFKNIPTKIFERVEQIPMNYFPLFETSCCGKIIFSRHELDLNLEGYIITN